MMEHDHVCPECGGGMVLRRNGQTHERFWGCAAYPACTGTRKIDGGNEIEDLPSSNRRRNDKRRWERE